jgi:hypothetical protein
MSFQEAIENIKKRANSMQGKKMETLDGKNSYMNQLKQFWDQNMYSMIICLIIFFLMCLLIGFIVIKKMKKL